ncbi:MAG: FHA domain-containing protein [Candidatus Aminicenantes bacterium]
MSKQNSPSKTCSRGHSLDPSWKICPYCGESFQDTPSGRDETATEEIRPELKKTVREEVDLGRQEKETEDTPKTKILIEKKPDIPALAWLIAVDGPTRASVYQLIKKKTVVGSSLENDIQLENDFVSSRHASIHFDKGKYYISDLDSANGTFVNERKITKRGLEDGDRVRIGDTNYVFKYLVL